jgi:hypothetical protein
MRQPFGTFGECLHGCQSTPIEQGTGSHLNFPLAAQQGSSELAHQG